MRLVLFDIDGTLLKTRGAGMRALDRALLEVFGLEEGTRGIRPDGKTDPQIVREALHQHDRPTSAGLTFDGFFRRYQVHFDAEMRSDSGLQVFCGAYRLVSRLRSLGVFCLGVATGNIESCARIKLQQAGLSDFFPFGAYGSDAEDRTEMIRTAISRGFRQCGRQPSSIFVIGDTPNDVHHGRCAGARTVAVATGGFSLEELRACDPDLAVPTLEPSQRLLALLSA